MDWRDALNQMPAGWGRSISVELLEACFPLAEAPEQSIVPGTHFRRVRLSCEAAKSSALGPRSYKVHQSPEWFARLGWEPIPYFDTMPYMRASPDNLPTEILIPVPDEQALVDFAYEKASAGAAWEGTGWRWPAKFASARVSRVWTGGGRGIWDGVDEQGRPIGGLFEGGPGWRDTSQLATFEIGHLDVWNVTITWRPQPVLTECVGDATTTTREIEFKRDFRRL